MTVLSAQSIRARVGMISPFHERTVENGVSYGLSPAGYDVRIAQDVKLWFGDFTLASTMERFDIPDDIQAVCHMKSTWARRGLKVFTTVLEPGWRGFLTLEMELSRGAPDKLHIPAGTSIAQIVFSKLDEPTQQSYRGGKYDLQPPRPVAAIFEEDH